jgi:hypothetical protein
MAIQYKPEKLLNSSSKAKASGGFPPGAFYLL